MSDLETAWFAVSDLAHGKDEGWFGPHKSREEAVRDMLSDWGGDPLSNCLVAPGHKITPESDPDEYDEDGVLQNEFEWLVHADEAEVYPLNVQAVPPSVGTSD